MWQIWVTGWLRDGEIDAGSAAPNEAATADLKESGREKEIEFFSPSEKIRNLKLRFHLLYRVHLKRLESPPASSML